VAGIAGRMGRRRDGDAARPAAFFIEFVKQGSLFDSWVADCALHYRNPNAPNRFARRNLAASRKLLATMRITH
jgi:hypothetical protein